jgi:hypothetical protein
MGTIQSISFGIQLIPLKICRMPIAAVLKLEQQAENRVAGNSQ